MLASSRFCIPPSRRRRLAPPHFDKDNFHDARIQDLVRRARTRARGRGAGLDHVCGGRHAVAVDVPGDVPHPGCDGLELHELVSRSSDRSFYLSLPLSRLSLLVRERSTSFHPGTLSSSKFSLSCFISSRPPALEHR